MTKLAWAGPLLVAACGTDPAPMNEPPPPPPPFAEAAHGPVPQLVSLGGPVLTTPHIQPIFWPNDAERDHVEDFANQLVTSTYWTATTSEYGVGPVAMRATISTTDPVPTTFDELTTWLASKLDGTHTAEGWPAAVDEQTIYSVFLPDGAVLHDPSGDSCEAYGAFHDEAMGAHGESIVFALMPRCGQGADKVDELTASFSHELIEAATDPYVETGGAYGDADPDNYVMAFTPGAETGDYCEFLDQAYQRLVGPYLVQRTWSNAAAKAGTNPCVPAPDAPYVAAVPMFTDTVTIDGQTGSVTTRTAKVPLNQTATIDIQLISDQPTDAFAVSATDLSVLFGSPKELELTWDRANGINGDVLHLTITRKTNGQQLPGSEIVIQAMAGGQTISQWWGYVSN